MKKLIAILISLTVFLSIPVASMAESDVNLSMLSERNRLISVAEYKLSEFDDSDSLTIDSIKIAQDFLGNEYTVFECTPTGYMIYDNNNGVFIEYSKKSPSPYSGLNGALYYCGPTNYFISNGNELVHTISEHTAIDLTELSQYEEATGRFVALSSQYKNQTVIDYVSGNIGLTKSFSQIAESSMRGARADKVSSVPNSEFFSDLMSYYCGYYSLTNPDGSTDGICGYIALAMTIAYNDKYYNDNYMDNSYWRDGLNKTALWPNHKCLGYAMYNQYGNGYNGIDVNMMYNISAAYFQDRNITISHGKWTLFTRYTIMNLIDAGHPVLAGGHFISPSDQREVYHWITIYKYTDDFGFWGAPTYITHFGWPNYSEVEMIGTIEYIYSLYSPQT